MNDYACAVFKAIDEKNGVKRQLGETCADRIVALERVLEAARDVIRFTEPEWRDDIDFGDADIALADAIRACDESAKQGGGT